MCRADDGQTVEGVNLASGSWVEHNRALVAKKHRQDYMDHMAKSALSGLFSCPADNVLRMEHGQVAKLAYDFAEAMWVEREARK